MFNPEHRSEAYESSGLCDCGQCGSNLVYPLEWRIYDKSGEADWLDNSNQADEYTELEIDHNTLWELHLRCPNCEWQGTEVSLQDVCEMFDEELDKGFEVLTQQYKFIVRETMEAEASQLAGALATGAIVWEDFKPA